MEKNQKYPGAKTYMGKYNIMQIPFLNDRFCFKRKYREAKNGYIYFAFILIFFMIYKYIAYPEPYTFEVSRSGNRIEIGNNVIRQDIIINEKSRWDGESFFSIYLSVDSKLEEGQVEISLLQDNKIIQNYFIKSKEIVTGFYPLDDLDYSNLKKGLASVEIRGIGLKKPVYLEVNKNTYNFPNCFVNNKMISDILVQRYHFYFLNYEFGLRKIGYALFVIVNVFMLLIICYKKENKRICLVAQIGIVVSYICLSFIYDNPLFFSPTWAEAVTNFMHNALNVGFKRNLLVSDAGYCPLFQRLITLFIFRILNVQPYYALFLMQAVAYIIAGFILSSFVKWQFKEQLPLEDRYLLSVLFIMQIVDKQTGAFINFIVYGIFIILLYFLSEREKWGKLEFVFICLFSCLMCLSKGAFVTVLPFMLMVVLFFKKNCVKRDLIFSFSCMFGATLQLIYYLKYGGADWFDRTGTADDPFYVLKLICSVIIDTPNNVFSYLEGNISVLNGVTLIIILCFWISIIYIFLKHIVKPIIKRAFLDKDYINFFLILIYIMGQGLFFRITVYGVSNYDIGTDSFWTFINRGVAGRYQIYIYLASICFFIVCVKLLEKVKGESFRKIALCGFAVCLMVSNPRFQLKGLGNDSYAANRTQLNTINAEVDLIKDIKNVKCRVVPIQPNTWVYNKNANLYCFGRNVFGWGGAKMVSESMEGDFSQGKIELSDIETVDDSCGIWQVFVSRVSLINNKIYQIVLKDKSGNVILQKVQDNTNYQNIVSFTFDSGVRNVDSIEIRDIDGDRVYIQNGIYIVTEAKEPLILAKN